MRTEITHSRIIVSTVAGTAYKVGDTEVTVAGDTITMILDGTNVKIDGVIVMACSVEDVLSSVVMVCQRLDHLQIHCTWRFYVQFVSSDLSINFQLSYF